MKLASYCFGSTTTRILPGVSVGSGTATIPPFKDLVIAYCNPVAANGGWNDISGGDFHIIIPGPVPSSGLKLGDFLRNGLSAGNGSEFDQTGQPAAASNLRSCEITNRASPAAGEYISST